MDDAFFTHKVLVFSQPKTIDVFLISSQKHVVGTFKQCHREAPQPVFMETCVLIGSGPQRCF